MKTRTRKPSTRKTAAQKSSTRKTVAGGAGTDVGRAANPACLSMFLLKTLLYNEAFSPGTAMPAKAIAAELGTEADVICYLAKRIVGPGFAVLETENVIAPLIDPSNRQGLYIEVDPGRIQQFIDGLATCANIINERAQLYRTTAQTMCTATPPGAARPAR